MKWRKVSPIPIKGRARHNFRGVTYTDPKTREHLKNVRDSWDGEKFPPDVPLALIVMAYKPLPKTAPKSVTREDFITKPDGDNILKAVLDGLCGVAFEDDRQVVTQHIKKNPRTRDIQEPYIEYLLAPAEDVPIYIIEVKP